MAARRWKEFLDDGRCEGCGGDIEPKRKAKGRKRCQRCSRKAASKQAARRKRSPVPIVDPGTG